MTRELCHHKLDLPERRDMGRPALEMEVWDNNPPERLAHITAVVLWIGCERNSDEEPRFVRLTPGEARALAALLTMAAEGQERRAASPGASLGSPPPPTPAHEEAAP